MMLPSESGTYKVYPRMTCPSRMVSWLPSLLDIHCSSIHRHKDKTGSWRNTRNQSTHFTLWSPWTTPNSRITSWNSAWKMVTLWLSRTSRTKSTQCWTQCLKSKPKREVNNSTLMSVERKLTSTRTSNFSWLVDWPIQLSPQNCLLNPWSSILL